MEKVTVHPALHVTIEVNRKSVSMYQPVEGGWRCLDDGPMRQDHRGNRLTFENLDQAAQYLSDVA